MKRMWINQPSTHQVYHKLHGVNVLALPDTPRTHRAYFLAGKTVSQQILNEALSEGWTGGLDAADRK